MGEDKLLQRQIEAEEELCDYSGDPCIGDKGFCEECPVTFDEDDKK